MYGVVLINILVLQLGPPQTKIPGSAPDYMQRKNRAATEEGGKMDEQKLPNGDVKKSKKHRENITRTVRKMCLAVARVLIMTFLLQRWIKTE